MKKSLIASIVTFMQNTNDMNRNVYAQLAQFDYVRNIGGGAKI